MCIMLNVYMTSNVGLRVTDGTSALVYSISCRKSGNTLTTTTMTIPTSLYPRPKTTCTAQPAPPTTPYPHRRYVWPTTPRYDTKTDHETVVILSATGSVLLCVCIVMAACFVKRVKRRKIEDQNTGNTQRNGMPRRALHEPVLAYRQYEPPVSHAEDVNRLTGARPVRPPSYRETPDISTVSYPKPDPPPSYRTTRSTSRSRAARSDRPPPSYRTTPSISSRSRAARSDPPPSYRTTPSISRSRAARSDPPPSYRTTPATASQR